MHRNTGLGIAAAALVVAAWTTSDREVRTDPAPVDGMLESATLDAGPPPESRAVETEVIDPAAALDDRTGSLRYSATALRPRAEWDLPKTYNDRVQYWIDYLAGANRERTQLWLEREGRYGPMLRERLADRGMPQDLVYLAMIESGLSPKAYSHAHASGMWQFISETGRRYGLEVSAFVDERRDPVRATDAALDYLSDLYDRFGSWYLAAAAYNSGENRVERILRERAGGRKGDDGLFWRIDQYLPRETRDYVPLMLAAAHIGKDPGRYGFHEIALESPLAYDEITVPGGLSLATIASAAELEPAVIAGLNTHLMQGVTPPGADRKIRVPAGAGQRISLTLADLDDRDRVHTVVHRVASGETLGHIARRYGVNVDMLRASNGHLNPRRLQVGQSLQVPVLVAGAQPVAVSSWRTYRVRRGDSLWTIARRHGVSVSQLKRWNGIGTRIYPGQQIRIQA